MLIAGAPRGPQVIAPGTYHASAKNREAWRSGLRARLAPQWKRLGLLLTDTEARVLSLRLGITNDVGMTHAQIARRFHASIGTIARHERHGLAKIRAALDGVKEA